MTALEDNPGPKYPILRGLGKEEGQEAWDKTEEKALALQRLFFPTQGLDLNAVALECSQQEGYTHSSVGN